MSKDILKAHLKDLLEYLRSRAHIKSGRISFFPPINKPVSEAFLQPTQNNYKNYRASTLYYAEDSCLNTITLSKVIKVLSCVFFL